MSAYLAAYDVGDDFRRNRVARVLGHYGHRVQLSVFLIWLEPLDLPEFRRRVGQVLSETDSFDVFPIDQRGNRSQWRWQRRISEYDPVTVLD
ncbi:MAG: CRISPR-associated endonuclease Cas2 [Planctomycetota bacterium]